jgi:hypothetical protein
LRLFIAFFVDAVGGRPASPLAEPFQKTHHPEFSGAILGLGLQHFFVHFSEFFTVITGLSLTFHIYGLTRHSQPFDNGESFL